MINNIFINRLKKRTSYDKKLSPTYLRNKYEAKKIWNFFKKKKYEFYKTKCDCNPIINQDYDLSKFDRDGNIFKLVICKNCGIIRAKYYLKKKFIKNFYKNFYRATVGSENHLSDEDEFLEKKKNSKKKWDFIFKYIDKNKLDKNFKIIDYGGGSGGTLAPVSDICNCTLLEYDTKFFYIAKKNNINTYQITKDNFFHKKIKKPNPLILSHVVEHLPNLSETLKFIRDKICNDKTLIYVEFPAIDSLRDGRRNYDFFCDIQIAHYSYFSSYVFKEIMKKSGFDFIAGTNLCQAIFIKSKSLLKSNTKNYYRQVLNDLAIAEIKNFFLIFEMKNLIRKFFPRFLINFYKSIVYK